MGNNGCGRHVLGIRARVPSRVCTKSEVSVHVEEGAGAERVVQRVVELAEVVEDLRGGGGGVR